MCEIGLDGEEFEFLMLLCWRNLGFGVESRREFLGICSVQPGTFLLCDLIFMNVVIFFV